MCNWPSDSHFHQDVRLIYYYFIWYVLCGAEWTQPGFRYTNKVALCLPRIPFNHSSPSTATLKGYFFKEGKERHCIYSSIFYIKPLWNLTVWTADSFEGWDERHSALWQECQKYLFFSSCDYLQVSRLIRVRLRIVHCPDSLKIRWS